MRIPDIEEAKKLVQSVIDRRTAHDNNFVIGEWVEHVEFVAQNAKIIATMAPDLIPDDAYVLGLLHDFGKLYDEQTENTFHGLAGYNELMQLGYDDAARISLTHMFLLKPDEVDYPFNKEALEECKKLLKNVEYDDYDKLIQLCDCLNDRGRNCTIRANMNSYLSRYSFKSEEMAEIFTQAQDLKEYFDKKCSCNIYRLIGLD